MSFLGLVLSIALAISILAAKVTGKFCDGGTYCPPSKECCPPGGNGGPGCCGARPSPPISAPPTFLDFVLWNRGFFWCLLFVFTVFCLGGCGLWCRGKAILGRPCCCCNRQRASDDDPSEMDSAGSCCAPPHYSACSSVLRPPPPYTEVTSKPELYPVVITYTGHTKSNGNYLMVQYFRNFLVHPPLGAISAGTTVDSISSTYLESTVPPPYEEPSSEANVVETQQLLETSSTESQINTTTPQAPVLKLTSYHQGNRSADNLMDVRKHYSREVILQQPQRYCELHYHSTDILSRDAQVSLSSDELSAPRGSLQDFVSSCSAQQFSTSSEVSSIFGWSRPASPPRATSPTCPELHDICEQINALQNEPLVTTRSSCQPKRPPVKSKTSFHLALRSAAKSARRSGSFSAPVTPLDVNAPLISDRSPLLVNNKDDANGSADDDDDEIF